MSKHARYLLCPHCFKNPCECGMRINIDEPELAARIEEEK